MSLAERLAAWRVRVRQRLCGLNGHDDVLHFAPGRMALQCTSCWRVSTGWDLSVRPVQREAVATSAAIAPARGHARRVA